MLETSPRGQWVDQPNATEITLAAGTMTAEPPPYDVTKWQMYLLTSQPSIGVPCPAVLFPSSIKDPSFILLVQLFSTWPQVHEEEHRVPCVKGMVGQA